jgi:ADP-ribose pyrophosphatase
MIREDSMAGKVVIKGKQRVFDGFFKVDEFTVSHEQLDGAMSADQKRLVFERGDAVAVLLLNLESKSVVLVEQFKTPALVGRQRDDPSTLDGWILETMAGIVEQNETPEAAAIRETMEETGYQIRRPKLIASFFSSPGGTSERIFLYFAEVRESDRLGKGGGIDDEDVKVVPMTLDDLFDGLAKGAFEDPKLIVAAYWLQDQLKSSEERMRAVDAFWSRTLGSPGAAPRPAMGREPLPPSTVRYPVENKGSFIGYKTGAISRVADVDIWVNSENTDMMMDRFLGRSVSASIRFLGANRDENDYVVEDTIEEALRSAVGRRAHVKIGTVLMTEAGALSNTPYNVRKICHVATVAGAGAGRGVKADRDNLALCVDNLLSRIDEVNNRAWRRWLHQKPFESVLIPMIGAGDGGLSVEDVAATIIPAALEHLRRAQTSGLKQVYFLAYTERDRAACEKALAQFQSAGVLAAPRED